MRSVRLVIVLADGRSLLGELVAAEGLVQVLLHHAFVVLHLRDNATVRVEVVDVGAGELAVVAAHANHDRRRLGRKRLTVLPVSAREARERAGVVLRLRPEDHHLEAGVEHERVGHPAGT